MAAAAAGVRVRAALRCSFLPRKHSKLALSLPLSPVGKTGYIEQLSDDRGRQAGGHHRRRGGTGSVKLASQARNGGD